VVDLPMVVLLEKFLDWPLSLFMVRFICPLFLGFEKNEQDLSTF